MISLKLKAESSKFKAEKLRTYLMEEQVIQKFSYRCPYCDQPISYDPFDLKVGENEIQCPSCQKIYFKIVSGPLKNGEIR